MEDKELLAQFAELWADADEIWTKNQHAKGFEGYVSSAYMEVYESLLELKPRVTTFVEWGSGLGVVTIMASLMGFDAYGIEAESMLVDHADDLAQKNGVEPKFAEGSFIPDEFVWDPSEGEEVHITIIDAPAAYDQLEMELTDFDLVYAYPWPDEHHLYHSIMRQFARPDTLLLLFDGREGMKLTSFDE